MRGVAIGAILASGLLVTGAARADAGEDLAKSSGCLGCHAVDTKKVGPAYKDVCEEVQRQAAGGRGCGHEGEPGPRIPQGGD